KPYLFGHPSVTSVAQRFSNASQPLKETPDVPIETYQKEIINLLVQDFNDVQDQQDVIKEKKTGDCFGPTVTWNKNSSLVESSH
ncbi:hypothetical protein Gotri_025120, partial [Gossypium trilobum]|nr:hypothetical protein [Gossypium trilobum]